MYPASVGNQWLSNNKPESSEEKQDAGNAARSWQWRERGLDPPNYASNKRVLENLAEDILVRKPLEVRSCDLPGYPRSTFLMVFSPDGTKVASTHGNHNVYVSELASGKHVRILKGHPRTPWCIAFHPSHPQLIGSGCLGGQVRVWDIGSGGSEVWNVRNETVIASIAFHPREQLLVIATYNELYFWDWSQPAPFTKVSTNNVNEKVRYVAFDSLGYKLITGISLWACTVNSSTNPLLSQNLSNTSSSSSSSSGSNGGNGGSGNNGNGGTGGGNRGNNDEIGRPSDMPGGAQDMIVNSYQTLVQRYDSLVRNYQRLFMVRHRLTNTPPPPNTIDRGTDPMETYPMDHSRRRRSARRAARASTHTDPLNSPSTSRQARQDGGDSGEGESSSRLLNLDVLSFDSDVSRNQDSPSRERSTFGSSSSAFQPLNESGRSFRSLEQGERSTRLLPNPFSSTSTSSSPRPTRFSEPAATDAQPNPNSSRTSIFTSSLRRRNYPMSEASAPTVASLIETQPSTSRSATQTPTTTNSSTQMSPDGDAQSINESLDLIRDILRDSGTRLLNLITNMSMNILSNSERGEEGERRRTRPRMRLFSGDLRRDFLASSSDSDSDHTEVNILRTPNSTFRESETSAPESATPPAAGAGAATTDAPTDRMVFELSEDAPDDDADVLVSLSSRRFRVRTQSASAVEDATPATREPVAGPSSRVDVDPALDPAAPSTSRDNLWLRGPNISAEEAYRRVRSGVSTLQKHTFELANMWLRGDRTTMRHLRTMWENLRRRIFALRRDTVRQDSPGYYTRSLLERCMILTEMTDIAARHGTGGRSSRNGVRVEPPGSPPTDRPGPSTAPPDGGGETETREPNAGAARADPAENGTETNHRATGTRPIRAVRASTSRSSPFLRRRLHLSDRAMSLRWRAEDDLRRRSRHAAAAPRLAMRFGRPRDRDFARAVNMTATRHEIRMRAMQVLSVMFNMMMMCLEERGLSQLIINMLKTLKKALALTCFMLVSNRNVPRPGANPTPAASGVDSMDVVRIQNVDHTGPVNVDGPDDPASPRVVVGPSAAEGDSGETPAATSSPLDRPSTSRATSMDQHSPSEELPSPSPSSSAGSRWSHRLAVQIADANRNTSSTARTRREMYQESKRQKALHRTNPTVHPLIKKRIPAVSSHRIPALRCLPSRSGPSVVRTPRVQPPSEEPVAGTSHAAPPSADATDSPPRNRDVSEFDNRENFIRIAHMQAVRLRNAARNRIRRLQTIRFYTPSSVQEIFAFQPSGGEPSTSSGGEQAGGSGGGGERAAPERSGAAAPERSGDAAPERSGDAAPERSGPATTEPEPGTSTPDRPSSRFADAMRRSAINVTFSPNIFPGNQETQRQHEAELRAIMNNVALPLMQVNDMAPAAEPQAHRLPRIHEYLQPIILAQNAMVVEEEGDGGGGGGGGGGARRLGGMAGLLDAGIISEALPAPSHRVQAWDFTTGAAPHIADSTKNVVVQRCRIHNDASIDISKDGRLLVALLPVPRLRNTNKCLGVYSLEWANLGQCLHTAALEQSAVSVALSPSARYLAVGLGSRRFTSAPHARNNIIALLYKLEDAIETTNRASLAPIKELEQNWEHGFTSLNCLRWAPQPGQGLVYANNTGQLIIMS